MIDAYLEHGSYEKAAEALGIKSASNIGDAIRIVKARAATAGYAPEHDMTKVAPEPYIVKGTSTYYGRDGEKRGQWVKTDLDTQRRLELIRAAIEGMVANVPRLPPLPAPIATREKLANLYTFTDYHLGMLAWREETGAPWNLEIAKATLIRALEHMVTRAPSARVGILNIQGDFMHTDGLVPVTPTHGHVLDAAARFGEIVDAAIFVVRRLIDLLLMHHEEVHVVIAEGNHDIVSSLILRKLFGALYEAEPRVTVNASEVPYYVYQHGRVMLAIHHGHLKKNESLPLFFAAKFPEMWGATKWRYCSTGHRKRRPDPTFTRLM